MTALDDLKAEYKRDFLGEQLYQLMKRIIENGLRGKPPAIYQPTGAEDVLHGFIEKVLIGDNQLHYFFEIAIDLQHFERLCYRQLRRYLSSSRQRTIADTLSERSVRILRSDERFVANAGPPEQFRLAAKSGDPFSAQRWRTAVTMALHGVPRIFSNPDERAPKVYTDQQLALLLRIVLEELEGSMTRSDLAKLFEEVLTPWIATFLDEAEPARQASDSLSGEDQMIVTDTVEALLPSLHDESRLVFRLWHTGSPDHVIAERLGVSRPTAINRRSALADRLRPHLEDMPRQLQAATLQSLFLALDGAE